MREDDDVLFQFEEQNGDIRWLIDFASVRITGLLLLKEAEELRTELTKAINKARKENS